MNINKEHFSLQYISQIMYYMCSSYHVTAQTCSTIFPLQLDSADSTMQSRCQQFADQHQKLPLRLEEPAKLWRPVYQEQDFLLQNISSDHSDRAEEWRSA